MKPCSDATSAHAVSEPPAHIECVEAAAPVTAKERDPSGNDSASSSDTDFCAEQPAQTARAFRARQKKLSQERDLQLVRSAACWSYPDEAEATAPHRLRHLRVRVQNKERVSRASACVVAVSASEVAQAPPPTPVRAHQPAFEDVFRSIQKEERSGQPSSPPAALVGTTAGVVTRPARALRSSLAAERRAAAAAISCLLS